MTPEEEIEEIRELLQIPADGFGAPSHARLRAAVGTLLAEIDRLRMCGSEADDETNSKTKPPRTLQEGLAQNRALVAAAPAGVRAVYKMNREFEARRRGDPCSKRRILFAAQRVQVPTGFDTPLDHDTMMQPLDAALHPTGRCRCGGEGRCGWCLMDSWRERAEAAEARVERLRAYAQALRAEVGSGAHVGAAEDALLPGDLGE